MLWFLFTQWWLRIKLTYYIHIFMSKKILWFKNAIVHNEDASITIYETCYLVTYKIKSQNYK